MIKLLMTWNINDREDQTHLEFVTGTFVPALVRHGAISDAWLSMARDEKHSPEMILGVVSDDELELRSFVESSEWLDLSRELAQHTTKFRYWFTPKIQNPGGFQM